MATKNFVPRADNEGTLGTSIKKWSGMYTYKINDLSVFPQISNASVSDQAVSASEAYLEGSQLLIPTGKLKAGTIMRWRIVCTKTAAGIANGIWKVYVGTNGSLADTARLTFTGTAQSAAADTAMIMVTATIRNASSSGIVTGCLMLNHNLATTGFSTLQNVIVSTSSAFDLTVANLIFGISATPGSSGVWTHTAVQAECYNLA